MTNYIPNTIIKNLAKKKYVIHVLSNDYLIAFSDKKNSFASISIQTQNGKVYNVVFTVVLGDKAKTVCQNANASELTALINNINSRNFALSLFKCGGRAKIAIDNIPQSKQANQL